MDRQTVYYGQLPREVDILGSQQNAMVALAKFSEAVIGTSIAVDGFTVTPTVPASLNVLLTPGSIYQVANLEASVWSSLPADIARSVLKQGIQLDPATFGITPPVTVGYSQTFLVQVQYQDLDTGSTVLPYYNAANPTSNFSGPGNSGAAQNTVRKGAVAAQIKAGIAAATGTQVAPSPDAGWTGLYTVTVANGATSISSGNISAVTSAPFIPAKLPAIPAAVQSGKWEYGADTGTANAMMVVLSPVPTALVPGMTIRVKKGASANTAAVTFDCGFGGANAVVRNNGSALQSGDLPASCAIELMWDGSRWQTLNFQGITATTTNNNSYILTIPYCVDTGTATALVAPFSPAITSLTAGDLIRVKLANTIIGPATATVNALTPIALKRPNGESLKANDGIAGQILLLEYDGTNLQVVNINYSGLSASANYYVATTGNDSNSGLSGSPWLTVQHALDVVSTINLNGYGVTINVGNGTYGQIVLPRLNGVGSVAITGDMVTPSNVVFAAGAGAAVRNGPQGVSGYIIYGCKFTSAAPNGGQPGAGVWMAGGSGIQISKVEFGACATGHMIADAGGLIQVLGTNGPGGNGYVNISGNAGQYHIAAFDLGQVRIDGAILNVNTASSCADAFAAAYNGGLAKLLYGAINGPLNVNGYRYHADYLGVIQTNGGGATFLPGSSAGYVLNGGVYG